MKRFIALILCCATFPVVFAQPNDCNEAVAGCSTPQFGIVPPNAATNVVDFTAGSISDPSTNPQGVNSGCLLSGETSSTFISISIVSSGTLQWSMIGLTPAGTPSGSGCFDWIMWPNINNGACAGINGNTLPPVACNWNGTCNGNTGMATPANYPPNASSSSYQPPINVTAGQSFVLCLSNYSGTSQNVNLNFFGSAQVVCGVSSPNQTICLGSSANVTIATPGYTNPTFTWLVTNGVSNTSGGTNVAVSPTVTTTYHVKVSQPAMGATPALIDTADFTITVVPPPAPNAGLDQTVCLGTPIQLSGSAPTSPNTCSWAVIVPPGLTPAATATFSPNFSNPNATVTVNQPGVYKFIWKETSTICGVIRDTVVVTVSQLQITATPTHPSCGGYADGSISITSAGATQYSFDNGVTWGASSTQGGFLAGTYQVCAKNALGCQKCATVTLIDPTPVVISLSNDTLICENGTSTLIASATGGTSYTYHWDHTASLLNTQQVSPLANTYYPVVAENELGCLSAPDSILVSVRPGLTGTLSPIDQSVCPGYPGQIDVATITGGIGQPYNFSWSTGFTNSGSTSSITESPQTTTTYTVTISDGCETTPLVLSTQIITYPVPVPAIFVDEPVQCEPASFVITNTTDPTMSAATIWNISDGQQFINSNSINPVNMYAGAYDVQLIVVSPDGCIDSTTFNSALLVQPQPVADFKWSPDPVTMFNTQVLFTNYSTSANQYQWSFENGVPYQSTNEDVQVMFPDGMTGYYDVSLIATSDLGCSDTVTKTVPVMPEVLLYVPNSFTPDGDEFNQSWIMYMEGIDVTDFTMLVYNRWGEVVWENHDITAKWDGTYHGKIVQAGTYTWTIRTKDALNDKKYEFKGSLNVIR